MVNVVIDYKNGYLPPNKASRRRDDFREAAASARTLKHHLSKLDFPTLARVMGQIAPLGTQARQDIVPQYPAGEAPGETSDKDLSPPARIPGRSSTSLRLVELRQFADLLDRIIAGLDEVAAGVTVRRSRSPLPDPLSLGVESLAALWRKCHKTMPSFSFKEGKFGDFAIVIFGSQGLNFPESEIRTVVRRVISARSQP